MQAHEVIMSGIRKRAEQTELEKLTSCGCRVRGENGHFNFKIDYCPLHAAAPELLRQVKFAADNIEGIMQGQDLPSIAILDACRLAIAKATEGK